MRQDYIEPEYVNGVKDLEGNIVIRPLDAKEKKYLNAFYEEVIGANFLHDSILKSLHNELKELKQIETPTNEQIERFDYVQMLYFERADKVLLYPNDSDQKKIYGENNARNRCVYNRSKATKKLDELNNETFNDKKDIESSGSSIDQYENQPNYILRKKKN